MTSSIALQKAWNVVQDYLAGGAAVGGIAAAGAYRYQKHKRVQAAKRNYTNSTNSTNSTLPFKKRRSNKAVKAKASYTAGIGSMTKFSFVQKKSAWLKNLTKQLAKNRQYLNTSGRMAITASNQDTAYWGITDTPSLSTIITNFATAPNVSKFFLDSAQATFLFTNQGQTSLFVTIYDVVAKKDTDASNVATPSNAWEHGLADMPGTGGSTSNYLIPGVKPFASDLFNQYYKVDKINEIHIPSGGAHTHEVFIRNLRNLDGENIQYSADQLGHYSRSIMVVAYAMPDNDSTTKTQVSTGSGALDVVVLKNYCFQYLYDSVANWYYTNNLPSSFSVGEEVMDAVTGTIEAPPGAA